MRSVNVDKDYVNEKLPLGEVTILGIQHVLAMYAAAVSIPLIIGAAIKLTPEQISILITCDLFTCGIATLLQSLGMWRLVGVRLPIIMGCSFVGLAPIISIGSTYGLPTVFGSIISAGIFMILFAPFLGKILRLFPPIVTGSIITVIGFSLVPAALNYAAGGVGSKSFGEPIHYYIALFTIAVVLGIYKYGKGFIKAIAVLIGLVAGTVLSGLMGRINFAPLADAEWFRIVKPFSFGYPVFDPFAITIMIIACVIIMVESIGSFIALAELCETKVGPSRIVAGLRAEGIATILGGIFNSFPYSTYAENVGLVGLTGIKSRFVVVVSGFVLITLALVPKFAALALLIPLDVLGGVMTIMFAMVGAAGIKMLSKVDYETNHYNLLIVTCAVGFGLGLALTPGLFDKLPAVAKMLLGKSGILAAAVLSFGLNIFFNYSEIFKKENKAEKEVSV